jgi:predicted nucleic acid-binding protein
VTGIVVADAGPLIALSRIDRLALLNALYGPVVVPAAVFSEMRVDSDRPGAPTLSAAFAQGAIESRPLGTGSEDALARMSRVLDPGEASAILLAEQLQARFLLIDERRGRQIARARGITVVGVSGVLIVAKQSGLLESVGVALAELSRHRYRLSDALVQEVLRLAGELD